MESAVKTIIKRDGQVVPCDRSRITNAIFKAAASSGGFGFDEADRLSSEQCTAESYAGQVSTVEDLQDPVESVLMEWVRENRPRLHHLSPKAHRDSIEAADIGNVDFVINSATP